MINTTDLNDSSLVGESFKLIRKNAKIGQNKYYVTEKSFIETNDNVEETMFPGKGTKSILEYNNDIFIIVEAINMPLEAYTSLKEFRILSAKGTGYLLVDLNREEIIHV